MDQFYEQDKQLVADTYKKIADLLREAKMDAGKANALGNMAKIRAILMKLEFNLLHYEDAPMNSADVIVHASKNETINKIDSLVTDLEDAVKDVGDAFPSLKEYRESLEEAKEAILAAGDSDTSEIDNMLAATGGDEGLRQARNSFMINNLKHFLVDIENQLGLLVAKED